MKTVTLQFTMDEDSLKDLKEALLDNDTLVITTELDEIELDDATILYVED